MSKIDTNILKDGQLAVATAPQSGTIISEASAVDATALVQTDDGPQLCVKTVEVGEGGGGGGGTVDQTYDATSTNAQSGTAVAEAVAPALKNTATGTDSLTILGTATNADYSLNIGEGSTVRNICSVVIGKGASAGERNCVVVGHTAESTYGYQGCVAVGQYAKVKANYAIAIGRAASATATRAIQLGQNTDGTNSDNNVANTLQVFQYQLLDGNTGKIPSDRLDMLVTAWNFSSSNYLADKNIIDFESGTSYDFIYHFRTRESGTSEGFFYSTIDYENDSAGGFDLTHRPTGLWLVQSKQGGGGWAFDDSLGAINNATDYWLRITWDGTTYTYIIATDKNFTDVFNTTTLVSSLPIKNSTVSSWFGRSHRYSQYTWGSSIYISDCIMKINGVTVFDGSHASNYAIVGNPNIASLLK